MLLSVSYCTRDEVERNAECLLGHVEKVRRVLRRKGFSAHAIEYAVTAVYRAAMPYITGAKFCDIRNRPAWVFKVAILAAMRATEREVRCQALEPAIVAAPPENQNQGIAKAPFTLDDVLSQLTEQQSQAVKLCLLWRMSQREAARSMGISVGTLSRHLKTGKHRLRAILVQYVPNPSLNNCA
jgi:RNA polymerase sigma factor (sigma-70 family)